MGPEFEVAFFDVDGTLVQGNTWTGILRYPRINRLKITWLYMVTAVRYVLYRLYLLGQAQFRAGWIRGLAGLLKGWPEAEVNTLFAWLTEDYLRDHYRQDVIALLEKHKAQGSHIVLISSIFEGAAQRIAQRLGADGVIATRLETKNGAATGSIVGKVCIGRRRLDLIRAYLKKNGYPTTLSRCIAYADSYSDAPMLAAMGGAVAVYPDEELRAAALEQGWPIHENAA